MSRIIGSLPGTAFTRISASLIHIELPARDAWDRATYMLPVKNPKSTELRDARAYCAGFIELDPISRVSLVTQLI
jgi:hypothetical protein